MPDIYNATQAALEIGISYRTMRRRIEEGKIEATRGEDGQYSIAQSEVERLKQAQSERPRPAIASQETTGHGQPDLEQRVADLERRVRTLEDAASHVQPSTEPQKPPIPVSSSHPSTLTPQPQIRPSVAKRSPLPEGCILASDFAKQVGIPRETMRDLLLLGIGPGTIPGEQTDPTLPVKEQIDYSERPKPGRPKETERYLTQEQQEQAIELLRKHGKLPS